ncbi:hypothetical protein [Caulobacter sp. SSI4214]|uniref:hypothetical protein n=1 Tax=Caulobacter sp. SSI4214 TaxID=2575739 RepID=UPI00143A9D50|nr:hypothetical protein [Caulobacter sp. SSI4214]
MPPQSSLAGPGASTNRQLALVLAAQLCCEGNWRDVDHRTDGVERIADRLVAWLERREGDQEPPPAAPAARMAALSSAANSCEAPIFTQQQEARLREIVAEALAAQDAKGSGLDSIINAVTQSACPGTPVQPHSQGCD